MFKNEKLNKEIADILENLVIVICLLLKFNFDNLKYWFYMYTICNLIIYNE